MNVIARAATAARIFHSCCDRNDATVTRATQNDPPFPIGICYDISTFFVPAIVEEYLDTNLLIHDGSPFIVQDLNIDRQIGAEKFRTVFG